MEDLTKVTINGVELDYNWMDMDVREKYIHAMNKYEEAIDSLLKKDERSSDAEGEIKLYRAMCEATARLFDESFGDGTGEKLFAGKHDFNRCLDALNLLYQSRVIQQKSVSEKIKRLQGTIDVR